MESENPILSNTATINPYRNAAKKVVDRLKWDFNPQAWKSRSHLRSLRDSHLGEKAVILCNGPSLLKTNFELLDGVFTFGLNKINLLFDKNDFRPNAIVAVNELVIEQNKDFYSDTSIPVYLDSVALNYLKPNGKITFLHSDAQTKFARDISVSVWQGFTVTTVALQMAFHMGFRQVAVVGCDHNFAQSGPANKTVVSGDKDESHFDPNYFAGGVKWQLPDLVASEYGYSLARETYNACGGNIYNCTEGGKLEVFERKSLQEFLSL